MMEAEVMVTSDRRDIRFDTPLYTMAEAARALGVPPTTFATWAKGYTRRAPGRRPVHGAPIVNALDGKPGQPSVPFVGLAEGMVLAAVRQAGVPLQRVRPALAVLAEEIGVEHALASRRLFTDGAELLFDHAGGISEDDARAVRELVVVRSGQRVFAGVVDQYLQRITYGPDGYASMIRLPSYDRADVVVDPTRAFGQPIFSHGAAPLGPVLGRFWAGEDIDTLSEEFGVPAPEIEDVLRAASRRAA
jgi:uncharacterized protein (DUF433 family)